MTIKSFFPFCLLLLCFHFSKAQWNPLSFEFESALYDLYFFDETTGVVVGDGAIWRTTDGGDSWQSLALTDPTLVGATIKAVHFCPGCTTGYAVGQNTVTEQAVIYQSEDSGLSWSELTAIPNPPTIWQDVFVAASRVLIVGSEGRMIRSLDGGQSWDEPIDFPNTTINSVAYRPGTNQTVYGTNLGVYRGTDTWASLSNGSSNIQDAYFDGGLGYAVGGNKIYRTSSNNSVNYNRAYSTNPALEFQCVVGYANGRMVGSSNGIYYIVSHGTNNWGIQPSTLGYSVTAIDYIDGQIAYAATEQGKVLKITAGHELTAPVVYFDNPPGACLDGTITFGNVNFKFGHDYSWEINGEAVATTPGLIHTFDSIGTYDIRLTGDNGSNTNSFSTTVLITNPPDTTFAIGVPEP
ncbi:MAG: YCF48-related protein, partial [Bacteroidota bacterium]